MNMKFKRFFIVLIIIDLRTVMSGLLVIQI